MGKLFQNLGYNIVNWEIGIGIIPSKAKGRRGRDRMVVGFSTTQSICAYHH
jgi:adenosyl cobinamide kinase/adenosyl cobinamide phosphate guanylyltransferase